MNVYSGDVFGAFTVLEDTSNSKVWVQCSCGSNPRIVKRDILLSSRQVGCMECRHLRRPPRRNHRSHALTQIVSSYVAAAQKRHLEWSLTKEQVESIVFQDCFYCGLEGTNVKIVGRYNKYSEPAKVFYNGIDRVDNEIGYLYENCVPACRFCNLAKGQRPREEFETWLSRVAERYGK